MIAKRPMIRRSRRSGRGPRGSFRVAAAALAILSTLALLLLGGTSGPKFLVAGGASMRPTLTAGDLILVRAKDFYSPGDVIAYHSPLLRTTVLHRVIRLEHGRYLTKGDANDWVDPDQPSNDQILGAMWWSTPGLGAQLQQFAPAAQVVLAVGLVGFALLSSLGVGRRRRPDGSRPHQPPPPHRASRPRPWRSGQTARGSSSGAVLTRGWPSVWPWSAHLRARHAHGRGVHGTWADDVRGEGVAQRDHERWTGDGQRLLGHAEDGHRPDAAPRGDGAPDGDRSDRSDRDDGDGWGGPPRPMPTDVHDLAGTWRSRLSAALRTPGTDSTLVGITSVCTVLFLLTFVLGTQETTSTTVPYEQHLALDYHGPARLGTVYPEGQVTWGQPIYPKLAPVIRVDVRHSVIGKVTGPVTGTLTLQPWLTAGNGWRSKLGEPVVTQLRSADVTAAAMLHLEDIAGLVHSAEIETGAPLGGLQVKVDAEATMATEVSEAAVRSTFRRSLVLRSNDAQFVLEPTEQDAKHDDTATVSGSRVRKLTVLGREVPVAPLRVLALALALAAGALTALQWLLTRTPSPLGAEIVLRYGSRLVHVAQAPDGVAYTDVASAADLFRVADQSGDPVLWTEEGDEHWYVVEAGSVRYRLRIPRDELLAATDQAVHGARRTTSGHPGADAALPSPRRSTDDRSDLFS